MFESRIQILNLIAIDTIINFVQFQKYYFKNFNSIKTKYKIIYKTNNTNLMETIEVTLFLLNVSPFFIQLNQVVITLD